MTQPPVPPAGTGDVQPPAPERYVLQLFVTGSTPRSLRAIANLKAICEEYLPERYELEVIDVYQHPGRAQAEQLVALPALVKRLPIPIRQMIGDLSDVDKVLVGLNLSPGPTHE